MASDIADAIARAQRDVEASEASDHDVETDHVFYSCMEGSFYCDGCMAKEALPALGPASVALAVRLVDRSEMHHKERHDGRVAHEDCEMPSCLGDRQALQDWADAQHSDAGGA